MQLDHITNIYGARTHVQLHHIGTTCDHAHVKRCNTMRRNRTRNTRTAYTAYVEPASRAVATFDTLHTDSEQVARGPKLLHKVSARGVCVSVCLSGRLRLSVCQTDKHTDRALTTVEVTALMTALMTTRSINSSTMQPEKITGRK